MSLKKYPKEILWTARYIMSIVGRKKFVTEQRITITRGGEEVTFGSADAYCKGHLFDLKTGQIRDYKQQMAAYALGVMQKTGEKSLTCHLVYSRFKHVDKYDLTLEEAESIVFGIVDSVDDPTRSPWPCEYCAWCDRKENCTALKHFAYTIGGQMESMKHINLNEPLSPAVRKRLLAIVDAVEGWSVRIRDKVNKE